MVLAEGDPVLLIDAKGRQFLLKLDPTRKFEYHNGSVPHAELIGLEDGSWVDSSGGAKLLVLRPRLADYVLRMKRGAQIVYPKDIGPILVYADIGSGMTVLEAGTGSGSLTMALLRAVGPGGRVVSVDLREDHSAHARKAISRWLGEIPSNLDLRVGDVADMLAEISSERIVLDLPEPGPAIAVAAQHQPPGGLLCAYLPTVPQVQNAVEIAEDSGAFAQIEVREILSRDWNVTGRSVRPEHSMVGHTGFLVFMRRVRTSA
ncbi:MAG: tRNA (adenine-N1)-methyltransferase [Acidimicrobiia bacterium]|nr:tRNA (adenine-N1)-methyltransferase [Acidimicrobiia bacterium]MDH3463384.1 tRNA (adenine-N1)-methyltransferase [Acidimicrobiia bacterium]